MLDRGSEAVHTHDEDNAGSRDEHITDVDDGTVD